ncbi:MAG: hypothetical protein E7080_10640 [Bacteroidales bacterium]|nr:hypothetical protein [Bacteroidales bacterium]
MPKVNLYRYEETDKVIITPNARAETDTPSRMRLIADENCILTDGTKEVIVIDVMLDEVDKWQEINAETEADLKAQAYDILMGVE